MERSGRIYENALCKRCGACCIAPSIRTAFPGMPAGKPPGVRCVHLSDENLCRIFGRAERPAFCSGWRPMPEVCGNGFEEAMRNIAALEEQTM